MYLKVLWIDLQRPYYVRYFSSFNRCFAKRHIADTSDAEEFPDSPLFWPPNLINTYPYEFFRSLEDG